MTMKSFGGLIVIFSFYFSICCTKKSPPTLQLVSVLFRHGQRTNENTAIYPNDPYKNETYYPYGIGELTSEGRKTIYNLGKALRRRYDRFLGPTYTPDVLEAISSNYNRTKTSLLLVLASLFPPVGDQRFEPGLNWQPIPFYYEPVERDQMFYGRLCPNFKKHLNEYLNTPEVVKEKEKNKELFEYLSEHSGWNVTTDDQAFLLYIGLAVEQELGFELPEWTMKVFPQPLEDFALTSYYHFTATKELKKLAVGYLLKKIIEDNLSKSRNELNPPGKKIVLYSGHELNVAYMLITLDIFRPPHIPPYGSYIIFELHKIHSRFGIKIFYQDYTEEDPHIVKLPKCEEFCPLEKFVQILHDYLPEKEDCGR